MPFNTYKDADGSEQYFEAFDGDGSSGDPTVPAHGLVDSAGGDVVGTTTSAAVTTDTNGTIMGFLRGLVKWAFERMPASLGQTAKSAAFPVTLASDEDIVKAEDAVHTTGDKGVMALGVRKDTAAALAGTDGDYIPVIVDSSGRLHVNVGSLAGLTALGQAAKAGSLPVTLASDEVLPDTTGGDLAAINSSTDAAATVIGSTIDAAVVTDATGTLSGKLRGLVKWAAERMPASLGQKTKAASLPVTLASDEDAIGISTGATDDAAAAGEIFPLAGMYDNTSTDEVDEGDVGRLRMSKRRGLLTEADFILTEVDAADLNSASIVVDGITFEKLQALKMGSEDGSTYGTTAFIVIPLAVVHKKSVWFAIKNGSTAHDQSIAVSVYISPANSIALSNPRGRIAQFTIPTTADLALVVGEGTVGLGGNAGAATATNLAVYACQIPRGTPYVQILLSATTPTTGAFSSIEIGRMS